MTTCEDFHNHMKHNPDGIGIKFGFRIYDQERLNVFLCYKQEGLIKITKINHHNEYTFIKFDITDVGQALFDMAEL